MPRKKTVSDETDVSVEMMTTETALEQFAKDNTIHQPEEETAESEMDEVLNEEEQLSASDNEENPAAERIRSETLPEDSEAVSSAYGEPQGMTREMYI